MSARFAWIVTDALGNGQPGLTVQLYRQTGDVLIGAFTDFGNGVYYIDHTISEKVYIKVAGVTKTESIGLMYPADDVALATNLASTATGKGASLIGVEDAGGRFTGTTIEAILTEIKTAVELASTATGKGGSLIGIEDAAARFTGTTIEAILTEIKTAVELASTATGKGAALIGVEDAAGRFTGTTVEAILAEIKTAAELISTADTKGANLIGVEDADGYFLASTVEGALVELGVHLAKLNAIIADAAELNKLDGASANVTAANLNTLTGAGETTLHKHNMNALAGTTLQVPGFTIGQIDLLLRPAFDATLGRGNALIDVYHGTNPGRAYVRKPDVLGNQIDGEISTNYEIGDLNFSGDTILGSMIGSSLVTRALLLLSQRIWTLTGQTGFNRIPIWSAASVAGSADGAIAPDSATTTLWKEKSALLVVKLDKEFIQLPEMTRLRMAFQAKAGGSAGTVKFICSTESATVTINTVSWGEFTLEIDLMKIPVTIPTKRQFTFLMKGDTTNFTECNFMAEVWAER